MGVDGADGGWAGALSLPDVLVRRLQPDDDGVALTAALGAVLLLGVARVLRDWLD